MTAVPGQSDKGSAGINIGGSVTGNVQSGSHARAEYHQFGSVSAASTESSEMVKQLLDAVTALRTQLQDLQASSPNSLSAPEVQIADEALQDLEEAVTPSGEADQGRIRRAVFTVTGALTSVTSLVAAVEALRAAAAPWF
ncbi:DUF5955 family protein [Actinacidiphila glaucinigra]|uniref:DUF5955 family protein n=1 Tax=Actinacidiphila glaucinigra TaxID=235986 RepID=UPI0037C59466